MFEGLFRKSTAWTVIYIVSLMLTYIYFRIIMDYKLAIFHDYGFLIFLSITFILLSLAFGYNLREFVNNKIGCLIKLLIIVTFSLLALGSALGKINSNRTKKAISATGFSFILTVASYLEDYSNETSHFPDANSWSETLINYYSPSVKRFFNIVQIHNVECNFAFNKNLSRFSKDKVRGETVLIFEADGKLNLSGGSELIKNKRKKDWYFKKEERFIYIVYVDGTVAKYRLSDAAIAIYDPEKDEFSDFYEKGQTSYSPLVWEP